MNSNENCPICYSPMGGEGEVDEFGDKIDRDVIGHTRENGKSCCYHRECLRASANTANNILRCYICAKPINNNNFLTLKERVIVEMKLMKTDAQMGVVTGLAITSVAFLFKTSLQPMLIGSVAIMAVCGWGNVGLGLINRHVYDLQPLFPKNNDI